MDMRKTLIKGKIPELRGTVKSLRFPCFAEIKYDGEANVICYDRKPRDIYTVNKYGTIRCNWHKLDAIQDLCNEQMIEQALFLCEIFYKDGKAGALYDMLSNKKHDTDLNIKIYDLEWFGKDYKYKPLIERKEKLLEIFKKESDYLVKSMVISSLKELNTEFNGFTNEGYEGLVAKNFDGHLILGPCDWVKMKKKDQNSLLVTYVDPTLERIEVQNVTLGPDGNPRYIAVGVKCPNKYKSHVKKGDTVTIEHQGILESGSLRHPVYIHKEV